MARHDLRISEVRGFYWGRDWSESHRWAVPPDPDDPPDPKALAYWRFGNHDLEFELSTGGWPRPERRLSKYLARRWAYDEARDGSPLRDEDDISSDPPLSDVTVPANPTRPVMGYRWWERSHEVWLDTGDPWARQGWQWYYQMDLWLGVRLPRLPLRRAALRLTYHLIPLRIEPKAGALCVSLTQPPPVTAARAAAEDAWQRARIFRADPEDFGDFLRIGRGPAISRLPHARLPATMSREEYEAWDGSAPLPTRTLRIPLPAARLRGPLLWLHLWVDLPLAAAELPFVAGESTAVGEWEQRGGVLDPMLYLDRCRLEVETIDAAPAESEDEDPPHVESRHTAKRTRARTRTTSSVLTLR